MADRISPAALKASFGTLRGYLDDLARAQFKDHATKLRLFVNYFQRDDTVRYLADRLHTRHDFVQHAAVADRLERHLHALLDGERLSARLDAFRRGRDAIRGQDPRAVHYRRKLTAAWCSGWPRSASASTMLKWCRPGSISREWTWPRHASASTRDWRRNSELSSAPAA